MDGASWLMTLRRLSVAAGLVAVAGCGLATAAGFAGALWWRFDLFAHFRVQYLSVGGLCAVGLVLGRRWRAAAVAGAVVLVNAAVVVPLFVGAGKRAAGAEGALRLVSFNVHRANRQHQAVADYLGRAEADLVAVLELTPAALGALEARFPEHTIIAEPRADSFGMALVSRLPLAWHEVLYLGRSRLPAIAAGFEHGGERYALLALHPLPPVSAANSRERDLVLAEAARWSASHDEVHRIVVGDLNATPWSHAFADLLDSGQLVSSQRGFGVQASWPRDWWPLSVPIDHCLHDRGLVTVDRQLGPFLGSDHRPLHVTLAPRPVVDRAR